MIPLSLGSDAGNPAFKVSYNLSKQIATIQYGTMNINSYFVSTNSFTGATGIGKAATIGAIASSYIYLRINGLFDRNTAPTISFENNFLAPDGPVANQVTIDAKPFPNLICLAFIDDKGKVFDLRPSWVINVFSFLG